VRPDFVSEELNMSVDVKNYDLTSPQGRYRLVKDVVGQTASRELNLPPGMRQGVLIDARGQDVKQKLLDNMTKRIVSKSGGRITEDNISIRKE
jgi:hypothetical protein